MTSKERARLRSLAAMENTIIQIGKNGITEQVIASVETALAARELIKGCVQQGAPLDAKSALSVLCEKTGSEPIQFIGRRFVMYRPSRENPKITIEG